MDGRLPLELVLHRLFDDGVLPAQRWKDGYGESLLEAAITHG